MKKHLIFLSILILSVSSCITSSKMTSTAQITPGTEVSFAKLMNPAYATDYINADVVTKVEFFRSRKPNNQMVKIPKDHVIFQVLPIGENPENVPFGNGQMGKYVFIPKEKSDMIFDLKAGDLIQLKGGTRVQKMIMGGSKIVEFIATDISKL